MSSESESFEIELIEPVTDDDIIRVIFEDMCASVWEIKAKLKKRGGWDVSEDRIRRIRRRLKIDCKNRVRLVW